MFVELQSYRGYFVDECGNVISTYKGKWRVLQPRINRHGYAQVTLASDGKHTTRLVHRLVTETFLGLSLGRDVNHIDGVKSNNHLGNLEYCSRSQNIHHSYKSGLAKVSPKNTENLAKIAASRKGTKRPWVRLADSQVLEIMKLKGTMSYKKAGDLFGVSAQTIGNIWSGKSFKYLQPGQSDE